MDTEERHGENIDYLSAVSVVLQSFMHAMLDCQKAGISREDYLEIAKEAHGLVPEEDKAERTIILMFLRFEKRIVKKKDKGRIGTLDLNDPDNLKFFFSAMASFMWALVDLNKEGLSDDDYFSLVRMAWDSKPEEC